VRALFKALQVIRVESAQPESDGIPGAAPGSGGLFDAEFFGVRHQAAAEIEAMMLVFGLDHGSIWWWRHELSLSELFSEPEEVSKCLHSFHVRTRRSVS
jgi:hypothetical protein